MNICRRARLNNKPSALRALVLKQTTRAKGAYGRSVTGSRFIHGSGGIAPIPPKRRAAFDGNRNVTIQKAVRIEETRAAQVICLTRTAFWMVTLRFPSK